MKKIFAGRPRDSGFALISTLMLLALIVLVVVAMLGMARQESRTADQVRLRARAQANAKLAVELALARLQEELGPDRRIAAPASIRDSDPLTEEAEGMAAPWLCGVWDSWRWNSASGTPPDYGAEKASRFRGWLVSDADTASTKDPDFPNRATFSGKSVELVGEDTLGEAIPEEDPRRVRAGLIEVTPEDPQARERGRLAWVCLDENTKARADLPGDDGALVGTAGEQAALLAGSPRFGIDLLDGMGKLPDDPAERGRALTLETLEVLADGEGNPGSWFHDLTTWSSGFHTDVVNGGLKHDLSTLFSYGRGISADYAGKYLLGAPFNKVRWEYLRDFANLWQKVDAEDGFKISAVPPAADPAGAAPENGTKYPVLPVVVRMQFAMSFYPRYHGGWNEWYPGWKHLLFFFLDPVVTLWNPYNVPLEFEEFRVTAYQLPISFRYRQNGTDVPGGWVHFLEQWYPGAVNHAGGGNAGGIREKSYQILIQPESSGTITLQPGEVRLFSSRGIRWDYANSTTSAIVAKPGFESDGGFALDWLAPRWTRVLFVNPNNSRPDTMSVSVKADQTKPRNGWDFYADFSIKQGGTLHPAGGVRVKYPGKLADYLIDPERYPGQILEAKRDTPEVVLSDVNAYRKWPFCLFSVQLRTEQDSRFPGRMWDHENPLTPFSSTPEIFEHPAHHLYELDLKPVASWQDIPTIDATPEGNSFFGPGEFSDKGLSFATHSGIPLSPPSALTDLRQANVSHASLGARESHVIGNSRAHPKIPAELVSARSGLDYRYLANEALWDGTYFSGLSPQPAGAFPSAKTRDAVIDEFVAGADVLPDRRYVFEGGSQSDADAIAQLKGSDGYKKAAAYQMVAGMFNVNSTSVAAWEALLGGLTERELEILSPAGGGLAGDGATEGVPVSRTALPNRTAFEHAIGGFWDEEGAKWAGYRRLDAGRLRTLAEKIVEEVKKRGPFLSLTEFINRRVGGDPALSNSGAVDAAIESAALNGEAFDPTSEMVDAAMATAFQFPNPAAALGHSGAGAPAFLSQADVLSPVANVLTVRSDTLRIRAYGDVVDRDGETKSRAWCEAVVQRLPEYVNPADAPHAAPAAPGNATYGRRFRIVHFRWLTPDEQ